MTELYICGALLPWRLTSMETMEHFEERAENVRGHVASSRIWKIIGSWVAWYFAVAETMATSPGNGRYLYLLVVVTFLVGLVCALYRCSTVPKNKRASLEKATNLLFSVPLDHRCPFATANILAFIGGCADVTLVLLRVL